MQALAIGEKLLQSRQRNAQGQRTWAGRVLHHGGYGSSGILTSLVRLYEISHDQRFLRAANEIAYSEDIHYDDAHRGWPDTRSSTFSYPISWGYGSLGVAMGRLSLMAPLRSRHPDKKLLNLLEALDATGLPDADGLAEGSAGMIDVMLSVARALPNTYYEHRAAFWCRQMITRARERGGYVCIAEIPGVYEHPGVWHGTAGIAYQLARMAYPRLFDSLLGFQLPKSNSAMASDMVDLAPQ
jgi:lantibiotic modifying enzyme